MSIHQTVRAALVAATAVAGIGAGDAALTFALDAYDQYLVVADAKHLGDSVGHQYLLDTFTLPKRLTATGEDSFAELPGLTHSGKNDVTYEYVDSDSFVLTVTGPTGIVATYDSDQGGITEVVAPEPEPLDAETETLVAEAQALVTEEQDQNALEDLVEVYRAVWDTAAGALS